jgi:hypothetical protein
MEGVDATRARIELSALSWFALGRDVRVLVMRSLSEEHGKNCASALHVFLAPIETLLEGPKSREAS